MTGHQRIVAMRRQGLKPSVVWVADYPEAVNDGLTIRVDEQDTPELLDLRFLVGTTVTVESFNDQRLQRLAKACAQHARRVIAVLFEQRGYRFEVTQITDTQGALAWPN